MRKSFRQEVKVQRTIALSEVNLLHRNVLDSPFLPEFSEEPANGTCL